MNNDAVDFALRKKEISSCCSSLILKIGMWYVLVPIEDERSNKFNRFRTNFDRIENIFKFPKTFFPFFKKIA